MSALEQLIAALQTLAALYEKLIALEGEKRDALVAYKPARVEQLTADEEILIAKLGEVSARRTQLLDALLPGSKQPTLTLLIERKPECAAQVAPLREHLRQLGSELARLNRLNTQLCGHALSHVTGHLQTIAQSGICAEQGTYNRRGAARAFAARALLNRNA
ncbi:MAG: flagellar protein FlgN [Planctomycetes bacterium]|nr:flagellar protein FlgN [Planctomycetota bacterium]